MMLNAQTLALAGYLLREKWRQLPTWVKIATFTTVLSVMRKLMNLASRKSVSGKVILITGAGSGIGQLMALKFAQLGGKLALLDINHAGVNETTTQCHSYGADAKAFVCDVSDREAIQHLSRTITAEFGTVDILINNAGIVGGKKLLESDDKFVEKTLQVNTLAHFWLVKAFLPAMLARNDGHIVTIASASGLIGVSGMCDYAASKWGAFGFDESLRLELRRLGKTGVHTTCVAPYFINTGMFEGVSTRFSWLLPILEPEYVADQIVGAIRSNQQVLCLPAIIYLIPLFRALLPTSLFDIAVEFLGVSHSMDDFVGRQLGQ